MQITVPGNYFRTESHRTKRIYKGERGGEGGGGNNKTLSITFHKKKKNKIKRKKTEKKNPKSLYFK